MCLSLQTELLNMPVDVIDVAVDADVGVCNVAENVNTWQWNIATVDSDSITSNK